MKLTMGCLRFQYTRADEDAIYGEHHVVQQQQVSRLVANFFTNGIYPAAN